MNAEQPPSPSSLPFWPHISVTMCGWVCLWVCPGVHMSAWGGSNWLSDTGRRPSSPPQPCSFLPSVNVCASVWLSASMLMKTQADHSASALARNCKPHLSEAFPCLCRCRNIAGTNELRKASGIGIWYSSVCVKILLVCCQSQGNIRTNLTNPWPLLPIRQRPKLHHRLITCTIPALSTVYPVHNAL
jgi:hypothetical protein